MNERDPNRTIILHDNRFTMVNTSSFEPRKYTYVLPSQCGQVINSKALSRVGWSFIVRYDPRGRLVNYSVAEEDNIEEEEDAEEQDITDVSDEEVEPNVLEDNAILGDDMLENGTDDDVDMVNLVNIFSKPNDIDVELYEELEY